MNSSQQCDITDIEINDVKASPHYTNGGTPAKCGHESEVTSDGEEGNVNSHMLKRMSEPYETPEDRRKSSCKTPDENRRPSRQIRLDSQSPLVSNMDEEDISEEEDHVDGAENFGSNGHLFEDEMLHDSMHNDDTFDSIDLKNGNVDAEMIKRHNSIVAV